MRPSDLHLLTVVAEPRARKIVSAAYGLPSGAIPVLAAVAFRDSQGKNTRPRELYEAGLGSQTLIRSYLQTLVQEGFVKRSTVGRIRLLTLTAKGSLAAGRYERELREGVMSFGHIRPMRVLTTPSPY